MPGCGGVGVILLGARRGRRGPLRTYYPCAVSRRSGATKRREPRSPLRREPARGRCELLRDRAREPRSKLPVELAEILKRFEPLVSVDVEGGLHAVRRDVQSVELEGARGRHVADWRLARVRHAVDPVDDPLEDAHVVAIAGPQELARAVTAEPV